MAVKNGSYEKFKAIQMNNEEIAQQDFAGMRRSSEGWHLTGNTANSILGGKPLLKAGGAGANILDIASTEPKPQTTGQAILKAAGKWKPLNEHYATGGKIGNQSASTKNTIADLTAQKRAQAEANQTADQRAQPLTTPGVSSVEVAATAGTPSAAKTYTVNGKQMTLGEYIKALGTDPNAAYRQNVAAANAAYDRQRATYGAEAEALAGQGLVNSGTSDYMDAQAYAAKQKAISQAATARDQQMTEIAGQHMSYLQQEKAAQDAKIQTALERAASMQLNTANTVKYLMAMTGMTKSEAERYAQGNAALVAEEDNTKATLQEITQTYLALMNSSENGGMGMSSEAARQYLKSGTYSYDAALVDQAVNNLVGAQEQAQADELAEAQKAVAGTMDELFGDAYSGTEIATELAKVGVNLTVDEKDGGVDYYAARDAITEAYNKKVISEADYLRLHRKNVDASVVDAKDKKSLGDLLQTAADYSHDTGLQEYAVEEIAKQISVEKKNINRYTLHSKRDVPVGFKKGKGYVPTWIELDVKFNGQTATVPLKFNYNASVPEAVQKAKGAGGEIISHNGVLYGYSGEDKKWRKVEMKGIANVTTEQEASLYKAMAIKYAKQKQKQ